MNYPTASSGVSISHSGHARNLFRYFTGSRIESGMTGHRKRRGIIPKAAQKTAETHKDSRYSPPPDIELWHQAGDMISDI
jgi:hypothetical protein